ncbi:alpha/beta fold hydrolase [Nocardioides sp. zg-ZUI104]|uniref:alpha/beta hydrolase n=1 Tax=Nocardioides faecalis TaxID=2803858 RepID=UPI001BCE4598|nr:alpha/beta hydrolase [Nocardioides faecalis]MBS4752488.1 alpha/beta fold hydrolase [Nocardioides faecalis]
MSMEAVGEPAFTHRWVPNGPRALALVLHGGAETGTDPVGARSLSWQRGRLLARSLARPLRRDAVGVVLLRYRVKGWNDAGDPDPVRDARWALGALARQHDLPVVLVGHSMGARTAVAVADDRAVRGVVALAPWLPAGEDVTPLAGKVLRAAHGTGDRVTSAAATRAFVARANEVGDARFTDMGDVGHYLLRRSRAWTGFALAGVREILNDVRGQEG